jgi:DNA replication protein DnaC
VSSRRRPENTWRWDGSQLVDLAGSDSAAATGTAPSPYQRLLNHLHYLELNTAAEQLKHVLDEGMRKKQSPSLVLERLLAHEVAATQERRLRTRARTSHMPLGKTLENFDFDFQPSIDRQLVSELSTLRFIEEKRNVILVGPPGVGKSHLAIALGIRAVKAGYRVHFTSARDLVDTLRKADEQGRLDRAQRNDFVGPPLLIIDELGYLKLDQASATWIFHVITKRYERGSIILTSNRGFADWADIFNEAVVATAIVDRLLHNAVVLNIRGKSYRMRSYQDLAEVRRAAS